MNEQYIGCTVHFCVFHIAYCSNLAPGFSPAINKVFLHFYLSYLSLSFFFLSRLIPDTVYSVKKSLQMNRYDF